MLPVDLKITCDKLTQCAINDDCPDLNLTLDCPNLVLVESYYQIKYLYIKSASDRLVINAPVHKLKISKLTELSETAAASLVALSICDTRFDVQSNLSRLEELRALHLYNCRVTNLRSLSRLITILSLVNCQFEPFESLPHVRYLTLEDAPYTFTAEILNRFSILNLCAVEFTGELTRNIILKNYPVDRVKQCLLFNCCNLTIGKCDNLIVDEIGLMHGLTFSRCNGLQLNFTSQRLDQLSIKKCSFVLNINTTLNYLSFSKCLFSTFIVRPGLLRDHACVTFSECSALQSITDDEPMIHMLKVELCDLLTSIRKCAPHYVENNMCYWLNPDDTRLRNLIFLQRALRQLSRRRRLRKFKELYEYMPRELADLVARY